MGDNDRGNGSNGRVGAPKCVPQHLVPREHIGLAYGERVGGMRDRKANETNNSEESDVSQSGFCITKYII